MHLNITTPTTFDSSIVTTDSFSHILKEVMSKAEKRDDRSKQTLISNIYSKLEGDLKSNTARKAAATFLYDTFGEDLIQNYNFLRQLSKKLNFRPCRLLSLLENHKKEFQPRNKCNTSIYSQVYNYWLNTDTVIPSVESRNSRNTAKISKFDFIKNYKHMQHINDSNISEIEVTLKKTNTKKIYVSAQRMIYSKLIKEIHQQFCKQSGITISLSLFYKLKPFYIGPPTEREKLTCLCKDCQNIHLLLQGVNTYRKTKTMMTHMSVANYLQEINDDALKTEEYPEVSDTKTINYYLFELKEESYLKNGKEINYKRTTRVERRDRVCDIVKQLKRLWPQIFKTQVLC